MKPSGDSERRERTSGLGRRAAAASAGEDQRLRLALELSCLGTWSYDPTSGMVQLGPRMRAILGEPEDREEIPLAEIFERIHPDDLPQVKKALARGQDPERQEGFAAEYRWTHPDGGERWMAINGVASFSGLRKIREIMGTARDITVERRADSLLTEKRALLEGIAQRASLEETLQGIARLAEEQSGGQTVASIMLLQPDGRTLRHGAAPSLPEAFHRAMEEVAVDPEGIACAAAAACNQPIYVPDLASNAAWGELADALREQGLLAVWSVPIRGDDGVVLGTLDQYLRREGLPQERERHVTGVLAETAALAIERLVARRELHAVSEEVLRRQRLYEAVMSNTPDLNYVFDLDHRFIYVNRAILSMWGKTWDEAIGKTCLELGYEPWHAEMHDREIDQVARTKRPVKGEVPFTGTNGRRIYEYILVPVFDAEGRVEAVAGATRDVTERKREEDRVGFVATLTQQLPVLGTEDEIVRHAVKAVGRYLGAHRCGFIECLESENQLIVSENWTRESAPPIPRTMALSDFGGPEWWESMKVGGSVEDVRENPMTRHRAPNYEELGVRSYASQPLQRDDCVVALTVTDDKPRAWRDDELSLLENVLARVWPLVERARTEKALRQSEERLRLVSDQVPALISYIDSDFYYRFTNYEYAQWFGMAHDDIVGRHIREVVGEETFRKRLPYLERVLAGETIRFEGAVKHHSLGERELEVTCIPEQNADGEVRGFYVMGFDITEHKRTRDTLARRGDRLRLLWESARILLTTDDPDTMLQRLFRQIAGTLGADAFFNYTMERNGERMRLRSWRGISEKEAAPLTTIRVGEGPCGTVAATGRPLVVHLQEAEEFGARTPEGLRAYAGYPLIADGNVLGTVAFVSRTRDAFSPDELEFIETISHYVTAAYVRLELVANLRQADRRKDEFLATLAHELRNPLAPVRTGIEVLRRSVGNPQQFEAILSIIERQTGLMARLIDDLVDVSRITRGKLRLRSETVDLHEVLASAVETARPFIDQGGHTLVVPEVSKPLTVKGDPSRLSQVFSNLLNNAARYTPEGGRIELAVEAEADQVTVIVRDNGEGIDPAMQEHIFEMFTQVQRTGKTSTEGLGIGLTLVRLLVRMHEGSIAVRSEGTGKGSEFHVTLPLASVPEPAAVEVAAEEPSERKVKVLVADDGASAADMLATFLGLEGFETRTAYDGMEALEAAEALKPDVAFLDLGMPRLDGFETARRLRKIPGCENIILIALTGWGQDRDRENTREAGFDHHLVKPVEPKMLRDMLRKLPLGRQGDEVAPD